MVNRRHPHTAGEKLKAIRLSEELKSNRKAADRLGINECLIRKWKLQKLQLKKTNNQRRAFRKGNPKFVELEEKLSEYILEHRAKGHSISCAMIRIHAMRLKREVCPDVQFKASRGWLYRFFKRQGFSVRRRTTMCQKLPAEFEDKLLEFQKYVIKKRKENKYILSQIGNADQTPVYFDMPSSTTVDKKGAKSVSVKTSGGEKQRCTVMLAATADGRRLPPYIIFKRKTLPKNVIFPRTVIVRANEKGWMHNELVEEWVKLVWEKRPGALLRLPSMIVLDSYKGHLTENVKDRLKGHKSDLVIIPGGMTKMLQPLDVSVNKPFKKHLQDFWADYMVKEVHDYTASGRLKKPSLLTIVNWVERAWNLIPQPLIEKAFKKCCISNAMDGTEDDMLWEEEYRLHAAADNEEPSAIAGAGDDDSDLAQPSVTGGGEHADADPSSDSDAESVATGESSDDEYDTECEAESD